MGTVEDPDEGGIAHLSSGYTQSSFFVSAVSVVCCLRAYSPIFKNRATVFCVLFHCFLQGRYGFASCFSGGPCLYREVECFG